MLKIQNNDNHETQKNKSPTPSLLLLLACSPISANLLPFFLCVYRSERDQIRGKLKKNRVAARGGRQGGMQREGGQKRYDDRAMFCACHPCNLLPFAFT